MRHSPRALLFVSLICEDPLDCTTIFAAAIRPPVTSCTSPRSVPRGFCPEDSSGKIPANVRRATTQVRCSHGCECNHEIKSAIRDIGGWLLPEWSVGKSETSREASPTTSYRCFGIVLTENEFE